MTIFGYNSLTGITTTRLVLFHGLFGAIFLSPEKQVI